MNKIGFNKMDWYLVAKNWNRLDLTKLEYVGSIELIWVN